MPKSKEIIKDLDKFKGIAVIADMDGGKLIRKTLRKDLLTSIRVVSNKFKELSHAELLAHCAIIKSNINLLDVFSVAKSNAKLLEEELEKALEEEKALETGL
jgi:hypothetical protein